MKKLLLLCMLFVSGFGFSQVNLEKSSQINVDDMIKNLDKSDFTSGILLDRSMNFSNIDHFNSEENKNPADFSYFKQALLDLYNASNKSKFISSKELKQELRENKTSSNIVNIGIISADYNKLNYNLGDEKSGGLMLKKDVFKPLKNTKAFLEGTTTIISPLKNAAKGQTITYAFQSKYWLNSSKKSIKQATISFGSNEKVPFIQNGKLILNNISHTYSDNGEKELLFYIEYTDGSTLKTSSKIYIIAKEVTSRVSSGLIENGFVTAGPNEAFKGYDETVAIRGRMDYRIYFRNGATSNTLVKPIIIIDGFDPGDCRRIEDSDCANDDTCASNYISNGQFDGTLHTSIREFLQPTDGAQNLGTELQSLGYDVILVNNPTHTSNGMTIDGGADYIERNGLTLTTLIKEVNIRLTNSNSNEQLVIVGPSMGGQISRYALAYMEKKYAETNESEWDHNTRLWISVDSPHLGANIPLGVQALLNQVKNDNDAAQDFVDKQLASPAAKQQLIEQYTGHHYHNLLTDHMDARTVSQGYTSSRGAPFFQTFYNSLFNNGLPGSKGYPQNLRKIALVNGAMNGSRDYESIHDEIPSDIYPDHNEQTLNIRGFQEVGALGINGNIHIASLETFAVPRFGSHGQISRFKKLFNNTNLFMTNINSRGNMDNVPGGWFDGNNQVAAPTLEGSPHNINFALWSFIAHRLGLNMIGYILDLFGDDYWSLRTLKPVSSFIPSFSAIGHLSPDTDWSQALSENLVCQNLTPFDSYFGHDKNTQHTTFNTEARMWLIDEVEGMQLEPYFPINPNNLVGSTLVCNNSIRTYTFNPCTTPGNVTLWQVGGGFHMISSTANSITVQTPSAGYGAMSFS